MSSDEVQTAIKNAVADATNTATLAQHMAQCERDKGDAKAEQLRLHNENKEKFTSLENKQDQLVKQIDRMTRYVWMAAGAAAVLSIIGKEVLAKVIGG